MMRVLILSCGTGGGHNAAGHAIEETLLNNGHEAVMLDFIALKSKAYSKVVCDAYIEMTKYAPYFFYFLYRLAKVISSPNYKSPVYFANCLMANALEAYLKEHSFDLIITPHLYPAETITYLKRNKRLEIPSIFVATDYTCIPFFEETECDCNVIASKELRKEYIKRGVLKETLYPIGIPVSASFLSRGDKNKAKERLGLLKDQPTFLIMSGSMGFGKVQNFTSRLLKCCNNKESIVVICGKNKKLYTALKKKFAFAKNVRIVGYTKHVASIMDAADVIFTKPGGLTSTEVAVKNIPLVHTTPIPGCETANAKFFSQHHLSCYEETVSGQISKGFTLLYDQKKRDAMVKAQQQVIHANAASEIMNLALLLVGGR